ncbi:helix-turn-helix domain-containing protein [Candidatus Palauibacter sp.]|uniref:helix-turn-helix domain-containing protein n=1 Tax=Candidatus Palauibacter sp. TaxID=3101350 RepID=UPI003CC5F2D9
MTPREFRAARDRLGFSVAKLARMLGVSPRTVQRWQNGTHDIPGPAAALVRRLLRENEAPPNPSGDGIAVITTTR